MNAKRIDYMLKTDPATSFLWRGFLAPDVHLTSTRKQKRKLKNKSIREIYILNTAPSYTGGEHWCCLLIHDTYCKFFDSYGQHPIVYNLCNALKPGCEKITFNKKCVQGMHAKTCGHHCIYYVTQRARGKKPIDILRKYSKSDLEKNDKMVYMYVAKTFGSKLAEIQDY